jgi:DNA topoisomerase IB
MEQYIIRGRGQTPTARLAYATLLMMQTAIRVGNEGSAEGYLVENKYSDYFGKEVQTYGCTTLLLSHVKFQNGMVRLNFLGKKQVEVFVQSDNSVLVKYGKIIKRQQIEDGQSLFLGIEYKPLKRFIKKTIGRKFVPKDIRTASVNLAFLDRLIFNPAPLPKFKKEVNAVCRKVLENTANFAGHTVGVCKSKYVSPVLFEEYKGMLIDKFLN